MINYDESLGLTLMVGKGACLQTMHHDEHKHRCRKRKQHNKHFTTYSTTPGLLKFMWNVSSINITVRKQVISRPIHDNRSVGIPLDRNTKKEVTEGYIWHKIFLYWNRKSVDKC